MVWKRWLRLAGTAPLPAYFEKSARRGLGNPDWKSQRVARVQVG